MLAVEMVTAEGDVVTVGSEAPDQPGLDLRAVVVGSEGTLGIITKTLVRLTQNSPDVATLLIGSQQSEVLLRPCLELLLRA